MNDHSHPQTPETIRHHYVMLGVNIALGLIVMYIAMFSMIDGWADFKNNLNALYMTLTMAAPMAITMLTTMHDMYPKRTLNLALYVGFAIFLVAAFVGTRFQILIGDRQFIASMVPHHSGAILMCRKAKLSDPELVKLCGDISRVQREEIEQMNAIAARLAGRGQGL